MELNVAQQAGAMVVTLAESRLDAAGVLAFKDRLRTAVDGVAGRVVLDLSAVNFLDSSGLGALVAARKFVASGALELAGLTAPVARVLRLTRMDTVFTIHRGLDEALAHAG